MKYKPSKIRAEREKRINARLDIFKKRKGHFFFRENIDFPEKQKAVEKYKLKLLIKDLENDLPEIKRYIKKLKAFVPQIWDQNKMTAIYMLTAKAFFDLEALLILSKEGLSYQIIHLARSGIESLDLVFLFLEEPNDSKLKKWFKGKYIPNSIARESFDKVFNSTVSGQSKMPVSLMKKDIYDIYSEFTHTFYGALLDLVDVFHEDMDYNRLAGYHFNLKNFDMAVLNLAFNILLTLKTLFLNLDDEKTINEIDILLKKFDRLKANTKEIEETLKENY